MKKNSTRYKKISKEQTRKQLKILEVHNNSVIYEQDEANDKPHFILIVGFVGGKIDLHGQRNPSSGIKNIYWKYEGN